MHNQSQAPVQLEGGINVKTGAETYVAITRKFESKLKSPFSNCISDLVPFNGYSRKLFSYFADLNVTAYDIYLCLNLCYQDKLIDKCGCSSSIMDAIRNTRYCESRDELECEQDFDFEFISTMDVNHVCQNVCQPQCHKVCYDLSISQATYPSEYYHRSWIDNIKTKWNFTSYNTFEARRHMDHSILRVIINYGCMQFEAIDESPAITPEELIGSVGGKLSLFVGISIISILEILEITSKLIMLPFRRCLRRCWPNRDKSRVSRLGDPMANSEP